MSDNPGKDSGIVISRMARAKRPSGMSYICTKGRLNSLTLEHAPHHVFVRRAQCIEFIGRIARLEYHRIALDPVWMLC